jgi:hypothetical protein
MTYSLSFITGCGGSGAVVVRCTPSSILNADGMGIWETDASGKTIGIAWADVALIGAHAEIVVQGMDGTRFSFDGEDEGVHALSALVLARVCRERVSERALQLLTRYAAQHRSEVTQGEAFLEASKNARVSLADRSGISS